MVEGRLEDGDAVSALLLGEIKGAVATAQDLEPAGVGGKHGGDAEAGGEPNLLAEVLDGEARERKTEIFGDLGGAGLADARQDGDELFAAETCDMVYLTKVVAKTARCVMKDDVSPVVAVFIIDGFETVEIKDDERKGGALSTRLFDGCGADLLERAPIEQAREGIGLGLHLELMLELRHGEPDEAESRS